MKINNIHDRTFKSSMKNVRVAREFFEQYLPEKILSLVELSTLKPSNNSYVDENLNEFNSDILFEVKLKNNQLAFLYVLAEHQNKVDDLMPYRIWNYIFRIWSDYIKQLGYKPKSLPLVFPLVFYNGKKVYDGCKNLKGIIDAPYNIIDDVLFKDFLLIDTHAIDDEELRKYHWAGVMAFAFKHAYDRDIWPHMHTLISMMNDIQREDGAIIYIHTLLKYLIMTGEIGKKPKDFITAVQNGLEEPAKGGIMTIAEQLIQEGVQQGMLQGMQQGVLQGMQQGKSDLFIHFLARKFSNLPSSYKQMIEQADSTTLLKWSDRIFDAATLEEVFED